MASTSSATVAVTEPIEIVPVAEPVEATTTTAVAEPVEVTTTTVAEPVEATIMTPVLARATSPRQRKGAHVEGAHAGKGE
ncbi:MAG: hypothetical protein LBI96_02350 [Odoribacteraceae bacterium]|jgi:hypothetical protein|nr:hypothetical protein [Odoribacteraceae bacterium]